MAGIPGPKTDKHSHMVMVGGVRSPAYPGRDIRGSVHNRVHRPGRPGSDEANRLNSSGTTG